MGMTEQLEKIAKEVADGLAASSVEKSLLICGIERFLAVLPKQDQVGYFVQNYVAGTGFRWEQVDRMEGARALYLEATIATPATEQTNTGHEDTERLNYLIKSGRTLIESKGWFFTYNHTSGRSGSAMKTPRAAIDASMSKKGGA